MLQTPTTPTSSNRFFVNSSHQPSNTSPLATNGSSMSAQAHSPSSFSFAPASPMQITPQTPTSARRASHSTPTQRRFTPRQLVNSPFGVNPAGETTRTSLMRERFHARCMERAQRDRERSIFRARHGNSSDAGSSDVEMDEDEDDDSILSDELFRRIMASNRRKEHHSYRVSYQQDVGSSLDPDMEDVAQWEHELREPGVEPTPEEFEDEDDFSAYTQSISQFRRDEDDWNEYADAILELTDADLEALMEKELAASTSSSR